MLRPLQPESCVMDMVVVARKVVVVMIVVVVIMVGGGGGDGCDILPALELLTRCLTCWLERCEQVVSSVIFTCGCRCAGDLRAFCTPAHLACLLSLAWPFCHKLTRFVTQ